MDANKFRLECNLLPLQLLNRKVSDFLWMKSSIQQDLLVAQHKDGSFSVLQLKNKSIVSNFVLDPNLCSAFWDNEEVSENGLHLFAQTKDGNILLYTVDNEGVTEKLHIPYSKICDVVKSNFDLKDHHDLKLVGCERRQIIFFDGGQSLISIQVKLKNSVHFSCIILLPTAKEPHRKCEVQIPSRFLIQNSSIIVMNQEAHLMSIFSITTGHCFYQLDLLSLDVETNSIREWRVSHDLSILVILLVDWSVVRVKLSECPTTPQPGAQKKDQDRAQHQEYLSYNLCWYGDMSWKQDVIKEHTAVTTYSLKTKRKSMSGFASKNKQKGLCVSAAVLPKSLCCSANEVLTLEDVSQCQRWTLKKMETSMDVVALSVRDELGPDPRQALCFVNFKDMFYHVHNLSDSTNVVLSNLPACSHMILSDEFLVFLSPHMMLQKDDLITQLKHNRSSEETRLNTRLVGKLTSCENLQSKMVGEIMIKPKLSYQMMSYGGPSSADSLCQANRWTRTAVPFLALEASLQQRQLDTLAFFFKSKQNLFSTWSQQQQPGAWNIPGEMSQLENALKLVITTTSVTDVQAKIFGERLLSLTLDFVYELIEDAKQVVRQNRMSPERISVVVESCQILMSHTKSLRQCMQTLKIKPSSAQARLSSGQQQWQFPVESSPEPPSLEQHVKENQLSNYQAMELNSGSEKLIPFPKVVEDLLEKVDMYLRNRDIPPCQQIVNNLGCDVLGTLWSLAQFYANRSLQQFVTRQLSSAAALSPSQRQIVHYVENLYQVYPNRSFSGAMSGRTQGKIIGWSDDNNPLKSVLLSNDLFLLSHCGDLEKASSVASLESEEQQSEDGLYACLLLAWLSTWTEDMKLSVMVDAQLLKGGEALASLERDATTWKFLLTHNLLHETEKLLEKAEKNSRFPWPTNPTDSLHYGWSHLRNEVARSLLRAGKLDISSLKEQGVNLSTLLPTVGGPMKSPHPLSYLGEAKMQAIHSDFVKHCVHSGLQLPLWMYCAIHGLNPHKYQTSVPCSWFSSLQAFYTIPRHPTDKNVVLAASLASAAELWSCVVGDVSVDQMLEKKQIMAAIGTLSYMSQEELNLDPSKIEQYLHKFPKLMATLLPEDHKAVTKENTTIYQLLMGTTPFDLRRLFGWQTSNTYAREDSPQVMPHFSETMLSPHNMQQARLSFPYYLKQGRPVYGFLSFLAEELDRTEAPLSHKRLQQACGAATWLACQNFNTPRVSSACVIFVELLGRDSVLLRTLVNCGRVLLAHRHPKSTGRKDKRDGKDSETASAPAASNKNESLLKNSVSDIVNSLLESLHKKHNQKEKLIQSVEEAIKEEIKNEGIGNCSFEASQKWTLVLMLCHLLSAPLSTCFLRDCAETNNWLMFVWFAQLHQYPTHQLQNLLQSFSSPHLRDHLHYVLNNASSKMFTTRTKTPSKTSSIAEQRANQRMFLYNKIGLQKSKDVSSSEEEEEVAQKNNAVVSSFTTRLKETELNESEMVASSAPDDVFRMLFYSRSMPSQWKCLLSASVALRNPLFAELAACCGCPPVPSLCGWLLASLKESVKNSFLNQHGHHVFKWSTTQLEALLTTVLNCGQEDTLATAFIILQPASPLLPFLCFVNECMRKRTYASCKTFVDQFKDAIASWVDKPLDASTTASNDLPTIGNRAWFEKVAYQILLHELRVVENLYHARHLVEILDRQNVCLVFSFDVLNFAVLHKVVTILYNNQVSDLNLAVLLTSGINSNEFKQQVDTALKNLMAQGLFTAAHELSQAARVGIENVTIRQVNHEKHQLITCGLWSAKFVRAEYWGKCQQMFASNKCCSKTVAGFYQKEIGETQIEIEKARLYEHWYSLIEDTENPEDAEAKDTIFREMWKYHIDAKIALEEVEPLDLIFDPINLKDTSPGDLKTELLDVKVQSLNVSDVQEDLTPQELGVLDSLMGAYLDQARISSCAKVAAVFGHYNQDLAIIQTCIALANGSSQPDNIEPAMRRLLVKYVPKMLRSVSLSRAKSPSTSSLLSNATESSSGADLHDVASVLEKLYSHCIKGRQVCLRILTCYKMAEILNLEYQDVIKRPDFDSLRQLLRINHPNKFVIARDFLSSSGLSSDEVSRFLADSIVEVLKMIVKGRVDEEDDLEPNSQSQDLMFNPTDGMEVFSQFMKLCENTSLLGDHILQSATALFSSIPEEMTPKVLTIQTELIILAHECYTRASSMEGISHVLRVSRVCCNSLTEAKEFSLIIRLLTGVGRYSEMTYIFHALQQHHQFELLLRKGMDREDKLKVAILDFLKRYQPDDNEAYTMVALKFSMYRDIGGMLEACGHRALKHLKNKSLDNSRETQDSLKKSLQYFQDAAESYVKDNSIRKAQLCVKMARLVSLQLQLSPSGITVIHMTREQVTVFTNAHPRFIEAMVVADAYERRMDWSDAVFNNVVVNNDMRYLQEMRLHVVITPALVEDVVKKYKSANPKPTSGLPAIRKLLSTCKDAQLQYRLAMELGLTDIVTAMLKADTGSFLQDVTVMTT